MYRSPDATASLMREYAPNETLFGREDFFTEYQRIPGDSTDVAALFHENTKLGPTYARRLEQTKRWLDASGVGDLQHRSSHDYADSPIVGLPEDTDIEGGLDDVLAARRSVRRFAGDPLTVSQLSKILFHACGETATAELSTGSGPVSLRSYPSAGALYPVEMYPIVLEPSDLPRGVYYYSVEHHGLRVLGRLGDLDREKILPTTLVEEEVSVLLVLAGAFQRTKVKYGPRGYRYVLQESGHVAQNVHLVATAVGAGAVPLAWFHDRYLNNLLGLDGVDEAALYTVALGTPA
jgi:SagB-type dehydrogenase family enzyme